MTDIDNNHSLVTVDCQLNDKSIEEFPLEDMLLRIISAVKQEADDTVAKLENLSNTNDVEDIIVDIMKMINAVELLQSHFEFIVDMLKTQSPSDVERVKSKHELVKDKYESIKSKEDIAEVPTKYVVVTMHDKLFNELQKTLEKCFKIHSHGEVELIKSVENTSRIKIVTRRFEIGDLHFPMVVAIPKDDIFCSYKSSDLWKDLYKSAELRKVLNKKQVESSFKLLYLAVQISFILIRKSKQKEIEIKNKLLNSPFHDVVYYGLQHSKAETRALFELIDPDIDDASKVWNLTENPIISKALAFRLPFIGHDEHFYIPRLFPIITKEQIMKEIEDGAINKICPIDRKSLRFPEIPKDIKNEILDLMFATEGEENRIPIRILAWENLKIETIGRKAMKEFTQKATSLVKSKGNNSEDAIIINIHGGGWIALSSQTYRVFYSRWAKKLRMINFCIDYRLAPKNQYPDPLDDIWQSYLWIMHCSEVLLGIKSPKIILTGDSAGGTLALALALRIVKAGLPAPHGCLLIYPSLSNDPNAHSPSFFLTLDHNLLPYSLLKLCVNAFIGDHPDPTNDPFVSPLAASDELLSKLPPIRIISGNEDPLQDDNWRFLAKMRKLKKDVKLIVYEHLSHAFLSNQDLKHYDQFVDESCDVIKELINLNP